MFYNLYLGTGSSFEELSATLVTLHAGDGDVIRNTAEELVISFDWATMTAKEGGQGLIFKSEDYGMPLRFSLWFDILPNQPDWAEKLMTFTGRLLSRIGGDCILESNGDTPILTRTGSRIVVDDKKLKGTAKFPFHALKLSFVEGDLEKA